MTRAQYDQWQKDEADMARDMRWFVIRLACAVFGVVGQLIALAAVLLI
jgi:hypothetical protein